MNSKKVKKIELEQKKNKVAPENIFTNLADQPSEDLEASMWETELSGLQDSKFENTDQALNAVVEVVMKKFYGPGEHKEAEQFLKFYLESDPEALAAIEKRLIKRI